MNWDDFRFFLALSREGSVSGAGKVLGVKHTTVARRVRALEERLGTLLFDRLPNGYAMTQSAENMFEHALAMEAHALAVDREVFGRDAELSGPLKLTASHDVADLLIMPRLDEFAKAYPDIDLQLITTTALVDFAAREADIALRLTAKPPDYLVGREVIRLQHGIYGTMRTLRKLSDPVNVILFRDEADHPRWVTENFPNAQTILRLDDVTSMAAATRHHVGLSRIPCFIGDSDARLRRLDVSLEPSDWGLWILSHVDLRATARVRVCREFLQQIIEQQRPLIQGETS
ncbi:MAG: LysR family transcriptional regulator, partial [Gammaproteobacteria bacterium]|nr:LysR family transcriptional regulator [Gammaproteobacteria bacterium]